MAVAKELRASGFEIVFLLGPAELDRFSPEMIRNIDQAGKCLTDLSLTEVLRLLSCADGFAGNDSGITHLAAGMGIKTLAVFGPTEPVIYRPIGPSVTIITGGSEVFARQPSTALQQKLLEAILS